MNVTMKEATGVAGIALRDARMMAGLSSSALGRASGMSKSAISAIETGRSNPTVETLEKLAVGLGAALVIEFVLPPAKPVKSARTRRPKGAVAA